MKQTLATRKFSTRFDACDSSPEKVKEFFDETFIKVCRELSLTTLHKEFYLLPPFLRLFNISEIFIMENEEDYKRKHPELSKIVEIFYTFKVNFYPKTSEESNVLEIKLEAHTFIQDVFQDFFTVPKTFKMRIDNYARE